MKPLALLLCLCLLVVPVLGVQYTFQSPTDYTNVIADEQHYNAYYTSNGYITYTQSGNGGNSIFGGGGLGVSNGGTSADGNAGTNYGSGGCGAISASSDGGAASVGGDGAPGIVIITEYI